MPTDRRKETLSQGDTLEAILDKSLEQVPYETKAILEEILEVNRELLKAIKQIGNLL